MCYFPNYLAGDKKLQPFDKAIKKFIEGAQKKLEQFDKVVRVNISQKRKIIFTVLIDAPKYDEKLMDKLIRLEMELERQADKLDILIELIYLPVDQVDIDTTFSEENDQII